MKILVDPQIYNSQVYGGISRYYTEILIALDKKKEVTVEIPIFVSRNEYLKISSLYKSSHRRNAVLFNLLDKLGISTRKIIKKRNYSKTINALQSRDYDVLIPTYYDPYFLPYIQGKPYVLTVYDMIHELFPQYFNDAEEIAARKLLLMQQAAKIIAVSHNTKKDILALYPEIGESKIEVVYHGSSIEINNNKQVALPENYILFVGVRENYKNFEFLVGAIRDLFDKDKTLQLLCAGGGKFTARELAFIEGLGLKDRITQKRFEEDELGLFYKNARCFVFPSAYEGFGIPVVEAMACGCPIVLTRNSSFPEVAGDAGIFYELGNEQDLRNKVASVLESNQLREEYKAKGLEQVRKFTWQDAAEKCYAIYREAAGLPRN